MEINDFSELTEFIGEEFTKSADNFKIVKPSNKMVSFVEKETIKYAKAYAKPLLRAEKRRIILWEAIDTMPHGFWWKVFHSRLWKKIKAIQQEELEQKKKEELENYSKHHSEPPQTYYPVVVQKANTPVVSDDEE